nr:toxin co-regulated pilus biosynthesis Q family protein [Candidatus Enterousia merdequi]
MFRKMFVLLSFAVISNGVMASSEIPEIVTSEEFYSVSQENREYIEQEEQDREVVEVLEPVQNVPVWPLVGSEADVEIACSGTKCSENKIVTKIGSGLVVENNIMTNGEGWTGGPDIINGTQIPAGFDYECANNAEMPLMRREMMEDDGGAVLAMSRSPRKTCNKNADSYAVFAERAGFTPSCNKDSVDVETDESISVNEYVDDEPSVKVQDQVRSWVVANGQTLREVLQSWCDKEGWDLVWTTSREYPIEASAVFKGRFVDVASALVRNFERATPIPYAKFYKGNRVLVISTTEE